MATEKRLIDAVGYCWELILERDYPGRTQEFMDAIEVAIADLSDMPTVDAVEVVRCKDCKSYVNRECKNLVRHMTNPCSIYTLPNDFCSYGERRAEDG